MATTRRQALPEAPGEPSAEMVAAREMNGPDGLHDVRLLGDMGEFLDTFFAEVERARRRVMIECFIVRADRLGQALADALARAAARGVEVALLYDPMGSRTTPSAFFDELAARGVDVRFYGRSTGPLARFWPRARNHSRIYVVDDAAYTGGHAWGDEWLPVDRGGEGWQDVCLRVTGPVVEDFVRLFRARWGEADGDRPMVDLDTGACYPDLRLVAAATTRASVVYRALLEAFAAARRRIWIANSYCFPPRGMLKAL